MFKSQIFVIPKIIFELTQYINVICFAREVKHNDIFTIKTGIYAIFHISF